MQQKESRRNDSEQQAFASPSSPSTKASPDEKSYDHDPSQPYMPEQASSYGANSRKDASREGEYSGGYTGNDAETYSSGRGKDENNRDSDDPTDLAYQSSFLSNPELEKLHPRAEDEDEDDVDLDRVEEHAQQALHAAHHRRSSSPLRLIVTLVVVIALLSSLSQVFFRMPWASSLPSSMSMNMNNSVSKNFSVGAQPNIVINIASSNLTIHTGNANTVRLEGGQDLVNRVNSTSNGSTLTLTSSGQGIFDMFDSSLDLAVPAGSTITIHGNSGDVTLNGLAASVNVSTSSGDIRANNLSGQLTLNTDSGDVAVGSSQLSGNSIFMTNSGDVDINATFDGQGSYHVSTSSGDVNVTTPSDLRATTRTMSGDVSNDFANSSSGASFSASTVSGDITVQRE